MPVLSMPICDAGGGAVAAGTQRGRGADSSPGRYAAGMPCAAATYGTTFARATPSRKFPNTTMAVLFRLTIWELLAWWAKAT